MSRRVPTVLQVQPEEAGAAALSMVLAYHRRYEPLEEVRRACGVSRDGTTPEHIATAAATYGLEAQVEAHALSDLPASPPPFVAAMKGHHYVVVSRIRGDAVDVVDPARGPLRLKIEAFEKYYDGTVIRLQPGAQFQPGGVRPSLWRGLRTRFTGSTVPIVYVILVSLALVFPNLIIPAFSKVFVDEFLVAGMKDWVRPLLLGMGLTLVLKAALGWLQNYHLLRLEMKLSVSTSARFLWHVLRLPIEYYEHRSSGEVGSRVAINDDVAQLLSGPLAMSVINVVMTLFYVGAMLFYDVKLTLLGLGLALLNFATLKLVARRRSDGNQRLLQTKGRLLSTSYFGLSSIETIKATGSESDFFALWAGDQANSVDTSQNLNLISQYLASVPGFVAALTQIAVLTFGGLRVMAGDLSVGALVAFQSLMSSFQSPIGGFVKFGARLQQTTAEMLRLDDVLQNSLDEECDESRGQNETPRMLQGFLELKNLTFGYNRLDEPLLSGFNLSVSPGDRVALVGSSGSGKSTVAKLICGLYQPWSGDVLLDGTPRREHRRQTLAGSLAKVDQEIRLFEGNIHDNVTLWDPTIPREAVVEAAKDACIHDVITSRPAGYNGEVDEDGRNFSGGQRQRLEIARALAPNPSILILDEATSALDPLTEKAITDNIRRRGCTCVMVAHRLSTIRDCDQIIVLENGKIVQQGRHDELWAAGGLYAELIKDE